MIWADVQCLHVARKSAYSSFQSYFSIQDYEIQKSANIYTMSRKHLRTTLAKERQNHVWLKPENGEIVTIR